MGLIGLAAGIDTRRNMYIVDHSVTVCVSTSREVCQIPFTLPVNANLCRESLYEPWIVTWSLVMIAVSSMRNLATFKEIAQFAHEKC